MKKAKKPTKPQTGLLGLFVLTPNGKPDNQGPNGHQGQVVRDLIDEGMILVRWYSWLTGDPTECRLYSSDDARLWGWAFYLTEDEWLAAGQKQMSHIGKPEATS